MRFSDLHPFVNLVWFIAVGSVTILYLNPLTLAVAFIFACLTMRRFRASRFALILVPMMLMAAIINPLFSHKGATVLAYFPSGNPLTLESILYGIAAALMLGAALLLCLIFGKVVTTDKLHFLVGRILPSIALLLSMIMRFIPRFTEHLRSAYSARCALMGAPTKKRDKLKYAATVTGGTLTWALENSLITADSMKSRGYGLPHRMSFTRYKFGEHDTDALAAILTMSAYFAAALAYGALDFRFYPTIKFAEPSVFGITAILVWLLLCAYPFILEVKYDKNK